jgi:hypothetical protein
VRGAFRRGTELHLGNLDAARTMFATGREQVFREGWDGARDA